jgi:hypothetical protein
LSVRVSNGKTAIYTIFLCHISIKALRLATQHGLRVPPP